MTFPLPIQDLLVERMESVCAEGAIARPLRSTDPHDFSGVFPLTWEPRDLEIGQYEPVVQRYPFNIQVLVKHASPTEGARLHVERAKSVREMLYRDAAFRVAFGALDDISMGHKERAQRYAVSSQRFFANEIEGTFFYLTVTEAWFETETVYIGG